MNHSSRLQYKKWFYTTIVTIILSLFLIGLATYIVDPYFHYHKPIMNYRLYNERYINDGIARHFAYDTIITGNSLAQNYKTSYVDELFNTKSVKLTYSGAGYKELCSALERNISYTDQVETVIFSMDFDDLFRSADWQRYTEEPTYLYDDNVINDIKYLLNKNVIYRGVLYNVFMTLLGKESTTFDEYSSWVYENGPEKACSSLLRIDEQSIIKQAPMSYEERERVIGNINDNILRVINAFSEVKFIIIIPPSSIAKWAEYYSNGEIEKRIEALDQALSLILECDNVEVFAFVDAFDIATNLNIYCDRIHYDSSVNAYMVDCINKMEHSICENDYQDYINAIQRFYKEYDYTTLNQYISQ